MMVMLCYYTCIMYVPPDCIYLLMLWTLCYVQDDMRCANFITQQKYGENWRSIQIVGEKLSILSRNLFFLGKYLKMVSFFGLEKLSILRGNLFFLGK